MTVAAPMTTRMAKDPEWTCTGPNALPAGKWRPHVGRAPMLLRRPVCDTCPTVGRNTTRVELTVVGA